MMRRTSNSVESINQGDSPVEEGLEKGTLSIRTNGNITGMLIYFIHVYIPNYFKVLNPIFG